LMLGFAALGVYASFVFMQKYWASAWLPVLLLTPIGVLALNPKEIAQKRQSSLDWRNAKIWNAQVFRTMHQHEALKGSVLLNCKSFDDIDCMFYQENNVYAWYPEQKQLDSLKRVGHRFVALQHAQALPDYIQNDTSIVKIPVEFK
jgi:hypothetical protein